MPALQFQADGGDSTQGLELWTATSGTGTVSSATDQSHTGGRAYKSVTSSGGAVAIAYKNGILADAGRRIDMWVRLGNTPTATNTIFGVSQASITNYQFRVRVTSAGVLQLWNA